MPTLRADLRGSRLLQNRYRREPPKNPDSLLFFFAPFAGGVA